MMTKDLVLDEVCKMLHVDPDNYPDLPGKIRHLIEDKEKLMEIWMKDWMVI
jgi:hypothetical protein